MKEAPTVTSAADQVRRAGWVGLIGNMLLASVKLTAGVLGHSQAVVADALHSITDAVTDVAIIAGVRFWSAPADADHPHGHYRIETLVAVIIGVVLAIIAVGIGFDAIRRIREPIETPRGYALAAVVLSIGVKEALYRWTAAVGRRVDSPALIANAWHHRSDALSSLPAGLAVSVALIAPQLGFVDRIGAVVVCLFILYAAWKIVAPALAQLVDTAAPAEDRMRLQKLALGVDGVRDAHGLRTRYVGPKLAVDLHVVVDPGLSVEEGHAIGETVRRTLLENGPKVHDVLVKVEPDNGHSSGEVEPVPT